MAALFANHLVAVMRPHLDGDEVPHATCGNKQRRLFSKNLGRAFFQPVDRGVFSVNVIADLGLGHGLSHLRCGPRHRIAPQVHHPLRNLSQLGNLIRIHPLIPLRHRVGHVRPSPCPAPAPTRSGAHRDLATSLLSYLINSTNTSFEILSLSGASRTMLPSRSTKPADVSGSNRAASDTP